MTDRHTTNTIPALTPEREAEIRAAHPGYWYAGPWCSEYVDGQADEPASYRVVHQESGTTLATLPDWAGPIALFVADAHDAGPELLDEVERLRNELTIERIWHRQAARTTAEHGPLWSLLDWSLWGAGMGDTFREPLADTMLAAVPTETVTQAEAVMAEFIERRGIEKTGVTVYQEQRDELERLRARVAELEQQAAEGSTR